MKEIYKKHIDDHIKKVNVNYKISEIAVEALETIKNEEGKVCNNFELCNHEECRSSSASWHIANLALKEIEALLNNKQKCNCKGDNKCKEKE